MAAQRRAAREAEQDAEQAVEPSAAGAEALPPFEASIERLEAVVDRLESGELSLEESLGAFEEGVALTRRCAAQLDAAEQRIEKLAREGSGWVAERFDPTDRDTADRDAADED